MVRVAVLVSGNGSNLQALLDAAASGRLPAEIRVVVSNRAAAFALTRAAQAGVETVVISKQDYPEREAFDARLVAELRQREVDWVVLAGFMRLVTPVFLNAFPDRIINVHPSLLPAFPGLDAGKQAFLHGVKVTGCTVHLVTEEMDAGPIIAQTPVPILETDTLDSLMQRMHVAEHETLVAAVSAAAASRLRVLEADASEGGTRRRVAVLGA